MTNLHRHLRFAWRTLVAIVAVLLVLSQVARVRATNHFVHLKEVMAGANGNSKIQFIVIEQEAFGQNQWGPTNGIQSAAMLVFFDATGRETGKFKFPATPPTGPCVDFPQGRGLILENIDGFPPTTPVFRKSPHLLNLSRTAPFGFSGNIPNLQTFAEGAVTQHFPRTLTRSGSGMNPDFRLPTADEKAAMEAFLMAQEFPTGNDPDKFNLDRFALTTAQQAGRTAFFGNTAKCSQCHGGTVLAQTTVSILGKPIGVNASFNTGVVNQLINSAGVDNLLCNAGTNPVGCGEFSTPQLFNVKNLGPFFHDASAATLRQAVEFYTSTAFNTSPAGVAIGGISMMVTDVDNIVAFLEGLSGEKKRRGQLTSQ